MKYELVRKGIVLGIIVLFIGAGIYPAIAEESSLSSDKAKLLSYKAMLRRFRINPQETMEYINSIIENNPEFKVRLEQLKDSDCIDCEENILLGWNFPFLCRFLYLIILPLIALCINWDHIFLTPALIIANIGGILNCWWYPY